MPEPRPARVLNSAVPPQRLLLLIPTTTSRTGDFVDAAMKLDVDLVIASDRPNMMAREFPDHLLSHRRSTRLRLFSKPGGCCICLFVVFAS